MNTLDMFLQRQAAWCKSTGLKVSNARHTSVLRWLPEWHYPRGFDHVGVYYYPPKKLHILLTEPYHSTAEALASIRGHGGAFSFACGSRSAGLWIPGYCFALLLAAPGNDELLLALEASLPTVSA